MALGDAMIAAFVLVTVDPGREKDVFKSLVKVPEIKGLKLVFGEYDLIARVESDDYKSIGKIVVEKVRSVKGVSDTKTLLEA